MILEASDFEVLTAWHMTCKEIHNWILRLDLYSSWRDFDDKSDIDRLNKRLFLEPSLAHRISYVHLSGLALLSKFAAELAGKLRAVIHMSISASPARYSTREPMPTRVLTYRLLTQFTTIRALSLHNIVFPRLSDLTRMICSLHNLEDLDMNNLDWPEPLEVQPPVPRAVAGKMQLYSIMARLILSSALYPTMTIITD